MFVGVFWGKIWGKIREVWNGDGSGWGLGEEYDELDETEDEGQGFVVMMK